MQELIFACLRAFLVGGAFCVIAQLLIDLTALTPARILVLYVTAGVALGAIGVFEPLRKFAGCGASVPLVGFGGTIARSVREAIARDGIIGILTGGLSGTAAGITAALLFGFLAAVCFKGKPKRL